MRSVTVVPFHHHQFLTFYIISIGKLGGGGRRRNDDDDGGSDGGGSDKT